LKNDFDCSVTLNAATGTCVNGTTTATFGNATCYDDANGKSFKVTAGKLTTYSDAACATVLLENNITHTWSTIDVYGDS
jgi:hypothetical protein